MLARAATPDSASSGIPLICRGGMARPEIDADLRQRIRAWTEYLMREHRIQSSRAMARRVGVSNPVVVNLRNGSAGVGLDYVVKLHRAFHVSADALLDSDPPEKDERR